MVEEEPTKVVDDPVVSVDDEEEGSDDDFLYEELEVESEVDVEDNYSEDLEAIIRSLETAKDTRTRPARRRTRGTETEARLPERSRGGLR